MIPNRPTAFTILFTAFLAFSCAAQTELIDGQRETEGAGSELTSVERLKLPSDAKAIKNPTRANPKETPNNVDRTPVYSQWHTITKSFQGLESDEKTGTNPFLDYRLQVIFTHGEKEYKVRGFYAADGNAAETGADRGNIWQVRFTPDSPGKWSYSAKLRQGNGIALSDEVDAGESIALDNGNGEFIVAPTDKQGKDFRAQGRLIASNGFFRFGDSGEYWIKGGANSPENLLAYDDFDGTLRMEASDDGDGEAKTDEKIHSYAPHEKDWNPGDPTWQGNKGKGLIGGLNYLSAKGMNAVYFLVLNILGDGKDVWPYTDPADFTRFDVSKLDQWEIVFSHMQSKGILMHMVLQETENETMLDNGETGPQRQLLLRELVARFGHHLGLTFNLGEENGFAEFAPIAQYDGQRREMTNFLTKIDPYDHPIQLHTHSHEPARADVLDSILGYSPLDGLSFQVDKREEAADVLALWKKKSRDAGHEWLISMDEIGKWDVGARSDSLDGNHDSLRGNVLWGTLLSGAAGVEWYFGANSRYNDLNTEYWRSRDRLWELTDIAIQFFEQHLPYWQMLPDHNLINSEKAYCLRKKDEIYAIYLPDTENPKIDLIETNSRFSVSWYDPLNGGALQKGSVESLDGGASRALGKPPKKASDVSSPSRSDWVVLLRKLE